MPKLPMPNQAHVTISIPDDLQDRIKAAAEKNNRSMNAEIVSLLESSLALPGPDSVDENARGGMAVLLLLSRIAEAEPSTTLAELMGDVEKLFGSVLPRPQVD